MRYQLIFLFLVLFSFPALAANVTVFASPDSSYSVLKDFLAGSGDVSIATYTFTSADIMGEIIRDNITATILVEGSPAGGLTNDSKAVLCELSKKSAVYLYTGPVRYMHAKYIVSGNKALVSSENLGDSGFPKNPDHGNRGWGAVTDDKQIIKELKEIFDKDSKTSKRFVCDGNYTVRRYNARGKYNAIFPAKTYSGNVSLIVAPNAAKPITDLVGSASRRVLAEQFYIYRFFDRKTEEPNVLLESLVDAARRGVNVSVLMDSSDYNSEEENVQSNLHTAEYINSAAKSENLSITARLAGLSNGIGVVHNKGLIVDDAVLVSSINWNKNSPTNNREIGIVIRGEAAQYFTDVFNHDFNPENRATGRATARNYIGIILIPLIVIFLFWLRKRARPIM